jgi:hypothetical protein
MQTGNPDLRVSLTGHREVQLKGAAVHGRYGGATRPCRRRTSRRERILWDHAAARSQPWTRCRTSGDAQALTPKPAILYAKASSPVFKNSLTLEEENAKGVTTDEAHHHVTSARPRRKCCEIFLVSLVPREKVTVKNTSGLA